jgi:prophage regulatory protein
MLRLRDVEECVGFSRSALYRAMDDDGFPRPVRIGRRAVAWVEAEVQAWLDAKLAAREGRA